MNLELDEQNIDSNTGVINASISKAIHTDSGVTIPYASVFYIHEFKDDARTTLARFANDPFSTDFSQTNGTFGNGNAATSGNGQPVPTIIPIQTDKPDADYFQVALGTSGVLTGGKNWFVSAVSTLGLKGSSYHTITAGFRGEF